MKTKICSSCGKEKSIEEFWENRTKKDGLQYICKKCSKKYINEYYQKNKKYIRKRQKEWHRKNPIKTWCSATINSHKHKGFKVLFTTKELYPIAQKITHCSICDTKLKYRGKRSDRDNASLDRINNEKILTLENTQIICYRCNSTKYNRTMKEFIDYCEMVYQKFGTLTVIPVNVFIDRGYGEPE